MNDIRRTILWVIFAFSLVMLWDQWQVHNGHKATFFPSASQTAAAKPGAGASAVPPAAASSGAAAGAVPVAGAPGAAPPVAAGAAVAAAVTGSACGSAASRRGARTPTAAG